MCKQKIAIFGGSFNPVHIGHIQAAQLVLAQLKDVDEVWLVPAAKPPHKPDANLAPAKHRLAMLQLAAKGCPNVKVSDIEINKPGNSYTYQTLLLLQKQYPNLSFCLIMGADMFLTLQTWKKPEVISNIAEIAVVPRQGANTGQLTEQAAFLAKTYGTRSAILNCGVADISSTELRAMLANSPNNAKPFLNEEVYDYIAENSVY
ncbi:MAG: nicotinate (nicotinamide) nucleotide adenylyltransferase [Oscillospiraceae bacterium]|jgi:nicotinate-nucleotide adenylyltransferase|nr:nicotinate (nicotinamide) nucleotide adenylyltransferase [Oscillospiraceae bacterium]